jgi:hypothetical protein
MSDSPNVSVIRRLYQARGNPEVIRHIDFTFSFNPTTFQTEIIYIEL